MEKTQQFLEQMDELFPNNILIRQYNHEKGKKPYYVETQEAMRKRNAKEKMFDAYFTPNGDFQETRTETTDRSNKIAKNIYCVYADVDAEDNIDDLELEPSIIVSINNGRY